MRFFSRRRDKSAAVALSSDPVSAWAANLLILIGMLAFGVAVAFLKIRFVPLNMDELFQYHVLICKAYPLNALNTLREACGSYDLNLFHWGWVVPLRSNAYAGSFPSLYYAPLFFLWRSPASAAFLGYLFLLAEAWALHRIFGWKAWKILVALLLFFPYAIMHLADMGPVAFQCLSIFLLYLLIDRWSRTLGWTPAILAAFVIFLGMWTKLTYFWLLPGIAAMAAVHIWEKRAFLLRRKNRRNTIWQLIAWTVVTGILLLLFFRSSAPGNGGSFPLWNQVLQGDTYSFTELLHGDWLQSHVLHAFLHPFDAIERDHFVYVNHGFLPMLFLVFLYLFVPLSLIVGQWRPRDNRHLVRSVVYYVVFLLTAAIIVSTKNAWATHHSVLAYPFLILSIGFLLQTWHRGKPRVIFLWLQKAMRGFVALTCMLAIILYLLIPGIHPRPADDPSKLAVNRLLSNPRLAQNYVYVAVDWGMYYLQGLYGDPHQAVLYVEPLKTADQIATLKKAAQKTHRKLLFIFTNPGLMNFARHYFVVSPCNAIPESSVWKVALERNADDQNPCFAAKN